MTEEAAKYIPESKDIEKWDERHTPEVPATINDSPMAVIQVAMQKGYDIDQIGKMLELQEKFEAMQSRKAYIKAMAAFKADPPSVYKDKLNKQFGSKYSSIEALVNAAIPYLSKQGLSHSWQYAEAEGRLTVTCIMSHVQGHQESVSMSGPPDSSGSKNAIQQVRSTNTYLKIATFEAITGLVSQEGNLDDDGNASEPITLLNDQQAADLLTMQKDAKISDAEFTKRLKKKFKVTKIDGLSTAQAEELIKALGAIKDA